MTHDDRMRDTLELTPQEVRVLVHMAHGNTAPDTAKAMGLSVYTVKDHLKMVRAKLQARTAAHAVAIAFERGIL